MVLFHSMGSVTLYTILAVIALLAFGTASNPLRVAYSFGRQLFTSRMYLLHVGLIVFILLLNKIEMMIESRMTYNYDFTGVIQSMEKGFVAGVQSLFEHPALTVILGFMYIVVFQALLVSSLGIYTFEGRHRMFYATCYAIMINYLVAIPFYLFFPVNEVWSYDSSVRFIMLDVFPSFESQYRELSGLDNCFPSLHTSISVTLAVLAIRSGNKRWAWFTSISALLIIFAIFYMGIHWLSDMLAGAVLGLLASTVGLKLSAYTSKTASAVPALKPKLAKQPAYETKRSRGV
ncbi:phosphatase PAP2 family protein [Paenibacillus pinihumi]|uniref:phosphatase PAP2 family protein n=1 Tax=Paenibacillus pinihumi TaxID=669462 RepID=UPI0004143703|nr:phosphatase PAP2 family protein [Paenibacillus pinihumi]